TCEVTTSAGVTLNLQLATCNLQLLRHYLGRKAFHCAQNAVDGFAFKFWSAVEGVQDNVLHTRIAVLADFIDDLLRATQQWPALCRSSGTVVQEFQGQACSDRD